MQLGGHDRGGRLEQPQPHARVPGEETGRDVGDHPQRLGGNGDRAAGQPGGVAEFLARLVELAKDAMNPAQEQAAEAVELNAPAAPVEQLDAELPLEARDRAAEGGLGDPQFLGGPAHVLVPGDGLEVAQLGRFHAASLCILSMST